MKVSIVTATYNSASTLEDTLRSVLCQSYDNYELIIKDGGSRDRTLEIAKGYETKFGGRLKILSSPDKGIYDAMNQGIAAATGDIIGILNSDDMYFDETVLSAIATAFEDNTVDAVCGDLIFVDSNDTQSIVRTWKGSPYKSFRKGWHPAHPTFYAKKELFEEYGAFDTGFDVSADFELMLRFIEKNGARVKYLDKVFVRMRQGGESTGSIKNIISGNKNIIRAFKKNGISVPAFYTLRRLFPKAINVVKTKFGI